MLTSINIKLLYKYTPLLAVSVSVGVPVGLMVELPTCSLKAVAELPGLTLPSRHSTARVSPSVMVAEVRLIITKLGETGTEPTLSAQMR